MFEFKRQKLFLLAPIANHLHNIFYSLLKYPKHSFKQWHGGGTGLKVSVVLLLFAWFSFQSGRYSRISGSKEEVVVLCLQKLFLMAALKVAMSLKLRKYDFICILH